MPLNKSDIKSQFLRILSRIEQRNKEEDIEPEEVQNLFAEEASQWVIDSIKSSTITIPTGAISVTDGFTVSSNVAPIVLNGVIS